MKNKVFLSLIILLYSCQQKQDITTTINEAELIDSSIFQKTQLTKIDSSKIVIDSNSNLIWMKDDFTYLKGRFLNNWNEIFDWEKEVNINNYAGYNDWRVPTIKEYRTINNNKTDRENYKKLFNYIDSVYVWGKGPYAFWSKTTPNKNTASYISFIDGFATSGDRQKKFSNPYSDWKGVELGMSARLVRDKNN